MAMAGSSQAIPQFLTTDLRKRERQRSSKDYSVSTGSGDSAVSEDLAEQKGVLSPKYQQAGTKK